MSTPVHFYDVTVAWDAGRHGTLSSPVLTDKIIVATPPEFARGEPSIWSPEHLLVAAVNSCLMTTFLAIAENSKLSFVSFHCDAKGKLEVVDGKFLLSEILLAPVVEVGEEGLREKTLSVLRKSEAACLISNSIKARIVFEPEVRVLAEA
ncbi:MAG: OsmC family peroxiredoxin [Chitinophagaceae bacterium]|nr:MAG: OsmC family peroxiredoxin [Chitinophagaceae bacterium]